MHVAVAWWSSNTHASRTSHTDTGRMHAHTLTRTRTHTHTSVQFVYVFVYAKQANQTRRATRMGVRAAWARLDVVRRIWKCFAAKFNCETYQTEYQLVESNSWAYSFLWFAISGIRSQNERKHIRSSTYCYLFDCSIYAIPHSYSLRRYLTISIPQIPFCKCKFRDLAAFKW